MPRSASKPPHHHDLNRIAIAALLACCAASGVAQETQQVVISVSGTERRAFDTPYAISIVDAAELRTAGPLVNLSEVMARVPGLSVASRQNYAQDLQITSRGFGARASFGVRGIRLYTDGIPAGTPDGQGQVAHFDLAGAQRIEVLRGPFSSLYGNSSGGVISLVSAAPVKREAGIGLDFGSEDLRQWRFSLDAPLGDGLDLRAGAAGFATDANRPHSAAERRLGNVRLGWQRGNDRVVLLLNVHEQPADDPLGLTRAQFDTDPTQTTAQAITFNTRKTVEQMQFGVSWRRTLGGDGALRETQISAYTGTREVTQFLAIAAGTQGNPRHSGGVIDFDRGFNGIDARAVWRFGAGAEVVTGMAIDRQGDDRRGYENFTGTGAGQVLGVVGRLRRDEDNTATSTDVYAQGRFDLGAALTATVGVRHGSLRLRTDDNYLANGDDSGRLRFNYTNPVAALQWRAAQTLNLYVSAGRGFESPTLTELAYRPDGNSGFNLGLKPQRSRQLEIGAKWRAGGLAMDAAVFRADTDDEIGIATNAGGRASFSNVGRTRREGLELSGRWQITPAWRAQAALTWLDATYRDGFLTCAGIPCNAPTVPVAAGNRIGGTMKKSGFAELAWRVAASTEIGVEMRGLGSIPVNDLNSDATAGVWVGALRVSHQIPIGAGRLELLARVDNAGDRVYAGSVIVNDANGRFFEPAAGRSWLFGATWRAGF